MNQVVVRGALALALIVGSAVAVEAQELTPEQVQEAMKTAGPGPEHARLARLSGEWDVALRFALGPDAQQTVHAAAHNRMILGGRFLVSEYAAAEPLMGMPLEGMFIYGFDRRAERWTAITLDTFGTYHVEASGLAASDGAIVMPGVNRDPKTGREEKFENVMRIESDDRYVVQIWFLDGTGGRHLGVEATHTRGAR